MSAGFPRGIGGYAVRWGQWSAPLAPHQAVAGLPAGDFRERFMPSAFVGFLHRLRAGLEAVEMHSGHDGQIVASTARGTLAVWADRWGLAFAAEMRGDPRWSCLPVSIGFDAPDGGVDWDGPAATVVRANLQHIALLPPSEGATGAYAGAVCWFDQADTLPEAVASLRARHAVGLARHRLPAHPSQPRRQEPQARTAPPRATARPQQSPAPDIMARIDRLLAWNAADPCRVLPSLRWIAPGSNGAS